MMTINVNEIGKKEDYTILYIDSSITIHRLLNQKIEFHLTNL